MSYLEERLQALNITPAMNEIRTETADGHQATYRYFTDDENGNIIIHYFDVRGNIEYYNKGRKLEEFTRTRHNPATNPKNKYSQAYGSATHVFCPPGIISKYREANGREETERPKVKNLYITEGEFKAFALDNNGMLCFGLGGINSFMNGKRTKLNDDITDFIKLCGVENVFLLYDADCFKCKWEDGKDLRIRAASFASSVKGLAEALKSYNVNVYMCHVHEKFTDTYKGIDDLLYSGEDTQKILNELQRYSEGTDIKSGVSDREYIKTYLISGQSVYYVNSIFAIENAQSFYNKHSRELINKDWVFGRTVYYADENGKVYERKDENIKNPSDYIMVGDDFFRFDYKPRGENYVLEPVKVKKSTITVDMTDKEAKNFISKIKKYDTFTYEPDNTDTYKEAILYEHKETGIKTRAFNEYEKLQVKPQAGEFSHIEKFLHHIFDYPNTRGESLFNFALDYLTLLYTRPKQKLPIICLVSKEQATGKSTFLFLLEAVFASNMQIITSADLESEFNSLWAGRFIVAIDEGEIPTDRKDVASKIKYITTSPTINKNAKGRDAYPATNHTHLIMCSNEETNFAKLTKDDNRYCIIKVGTLEGERQSKYIDLMRPEIPAFLYYLKTRPLFYEEKERTYFDFDVYKTDQLNRVVIANENPISVAIKDILFKQFMLQKTDRIEITTDILLQQVKPLLSNKASIDIKRVNAFFSDLEIKPTNTSREGVFVKEIQGNIINETIRGRRWIIPSEKVLTEEELKVLKDTIFESKQPKVEQTNLFEEEETTDNEFLY